MANEKLVEAVARELEPGCLKPAWGRSLATLAIKALAAALRDDPEAVEAMLAKITAFPRRETVAAMRDALADWMEHGK